MTILGVFLNNQLRTGGNRRYLELLEGLAERGNRVFVIMNEGLDYTPVRFTKIDLRVDYRRKGFPPASSLFRRAVAKHLETIKGKIAETGQGEVDWIHIHGDMHLKAAVYLKKRLGARLFYAFRCNDVRRARILRASAPPGLKELPEKLKSRLYEVVNRARERTVAREADLVTFQNVPDRDDYLERTGSAASKTVIIPGNIGLPRCRPEWKNRNASASVKTLLYVGLLSLSKGLKILLEALALLEARGTGGLRLLVLGRLENTGPVEELLARLGLADRVSLEGFQDPFPYLAKADLMVYPSLYDAFPDAVLEALHVGCPAIASAVGGIPDILEEEDLLFASGDVTGLVDRIERCVTDPSYYLRLRELCEKRAKVFAFDWYERFEKAMR